MNNQTQLIDLGIALEKIQKLKQQLEEAVEVIERMKCNEDIDSEDCPKCSFLAKYRGEK